jgi:4-hydroxyphenylpyruvate dioxygenase
MTDNDREAIGDAPNPLGLDGIEYIEFTTRQPQALGHVLENLGFKPIARHRSREVLLYRQGGMNIVINTHTGVLRESEAADPGHPRITALALRVRDARFAYERALDLGAWDVPSHAQVMELNIPGIHGPAGAQIYFVDRYRDFSIYDIDFRPIPGVDQHPPAANGLQGLHFFGVVQYIGRNRTDDWREFYGRLLGFVPLPPETRFGILPKGMVLQAPAALNDSADAPASRFYLQLIEPDPATVVDDEQELFHRVGFGTPDVPATAAVLQARGVEFVESAKLKTGTRGALTRTVMHTVVFELVHDER